MIKVVQLGIAQLRGSADLAQSDDAQTPSPPAVSPTVGTDAKWLRPIADLPEEPWFGHISCWPPVSCRARSLAANQKMRGRHHRSSLPLCC
jgi:hypothetical protein